MKNLSTGISLVSMLLCALLLLGSFLLIIFGIRMFASEALPALLGTNPPF